MLEEYPAQVSREALLSSEERRRMTESNRVQAARSKPQALPSEWSDDRAQRLERYRQSAMNFRSAAAQSEPQRTTEPAESAEFLHTSSEASQRSDQSDFGRFRGRFRYIFGSGAVAEWQEDDDPAEDTQEPEEETEQQEPMYASAADGYDAYEDENETFASTDAQPEDEYFAYETPGQFARVLIGRFRDLIGPNYRRKKASAIKAAVLGVMATALLGCVIYGRVQTNEIYTQIAEAQSKYDDLQATNISLRSEIDGKTTVKNVEKYAEEVLGLKPLDDSQIQYIQLQTEDEVQIPEPEKNFFVRLQEKITAIWEWLRGV